MYRYKLSIEEFRQEARGRFQLELGNNKGAEARPLSAADILAMDFPENPFQLENVFRSGELILIAGTRKTNKSFISLDILTSLACAGKLSETIFAQQKWVVALIDAELSLQNISDRLNRIIGLHGGQGAWAENMTIVSLKHKGKQIDISREEDQNWLEMQIGSAQIVVFDNFGKIIRHGSEACVKTWRTIEAWFAGLQQKGITVILVHHENKEGQVRGTQKMEDDVDLLISLKRPEKWTSADGNIVEVHFPAARHLHGDQVKPFTVRYAEDEKDFRRSIGTVDGSQAVSPDASIPLISADEIEKYKLSSLQVDILGMARGKGEVRAKDVVDDGGNGRSRSSVSEAFKGLCDNGLLKAAGEKRGRFYRPVSE